MTQMTNKRIQQIIKEEIENVKWGKTPLNESIEAGDEEQIRQIIRDEVASIFFTLFKRRKTWNA